MTRPRWRVRTLVAAYAVSSYGNYLSLIALSLFSYEVTGSGLGLGLLMALRLSSGFLAGLGAGALTSRIGRRTVMIGTDVAQAAALTVLALCAASTTPVWLLAAVVTVLGAGNTLFGVALRSAVPVIVGQEGRGRANGQLVTARSLATVAGFASAAPVVGAAGHGAAFAVNAASFLVSAAALLLTRPRTDEDRPAAGDTTAPQPASGRRALTAVPALLLGMLLLRGVDALASSSHNVALPVVAAAESPEHPAVFMTRFWAAWAVGALMAHQVLKRRWTPRNENRWGPPAFAGGTCVMSLCFVLAFTAPAPAALMVIAGLAGLADGFTEIVYTSRLQAVPDRERSRLFGLSATAETSGFTLGTVAAAAALDAWPALVVVGLFHTAAACCALLFLLFCATRRAGGRSSRQEGAHLRDRHVDGSPVPRA
ncbi:MFS transporter [Streptomyces macrosporus]|uniref:Major facilitator superfamily (MFS) profile domain-containing protein n=1 Tax=Streptomyces macrosporus TaxID=44032 RepID=A0ABP5XR99_9ACTN